MHISEGVLSLPVLVSGDVIVAAGTYLGIRRLEEKDIPEVAILSAGFFVASLIHIPVGPSSVHLILNGLVGILLGWISFPAILLALFLQAILFQFGGLTTLGVNTANMALPAVICWYLFRKGVRKEGIIFDIFSFMAGFSGVFFGAVFVALSLVSTGEIFLNISKAVIVAHLPVMVIEGFITLFILKFLKKAKPEILEIKGR
ncbi:cobalt transporter CbiM [bacterium]|nr:cobalt transporter CbiM [bacterium]